MGWSTYFAFLFAAVNTLTVTYYLAIERLPVLKEIFPSFVIYVVIIVAIGIPILTLIGYIHYKKSVAFKTESEVYFESNPVFQRMLFNSEFNLSMNLELSKLIVKLLNNEKFSNEEIKNLSKMQKELSEHIKEQPYTKSQVTKFD
jgi:uncharacterized membrane-anchored protein